MDNSKIVDLKKPELLKISGGGIPKWTPWGFGVWLAYETISNWSDIKSGISDAIEDYRSAINK